jgi:hypothetical protein
MLRFTRDMAAPRDLIRLFVKRGVKTGPSVSLAASPPRIKAPGAIQFLLRFACPIHYSGGSACQKKI